MKDEAALINLNMCNILTTCHCIRESDFTRICKFGGEQEFIRRLISRFVCRRIRFFYVKQWLCQPYNNFFEMHKLN